MIPESAKENRILNEEIDKGGLIESWYGGLFRGMRNTCSFSFC